MIEHFIRKWFPVMLKVQAIGAPFDVAFSSSGKRKPKGFIWTTDPCDIQVHIDMGLMRGATGKTNNKKFGWFCESRIVKENIFNDITRNLNKYKQSYRSIFTCDTDLIKLDPNLFSFSFSGSNLPWTLDEEFKIYNKSKLVSLISSPKESTVGHKNRIKLAEQFKHNVDLYGGIFGSNQIGVQPKEHYHHRSKSKALQDYMFSITIENFKYDDYFTEKITDCFANGVIPVYYGADNIGKYFDQNGIITLNDRFKFEDLTEELYESKLDSIRNNLNLVSLLEGADDMIIRKIQEIL